MNPVQPVHDNPAWLRLLHGAVSIAAFVAALCVVCWIIHETLPFPEVPIVTPKVEHLKAHGDRYDTLIIGSSRLYYQVIPSLFDELTAQAGVPTKTFNAAVAGMGPPEDSFML